MKPKLIVNWYKPTGKWYTSWAEEIPEDLPGSPGSAERFVIANQKVLSKHFYLGSWYMVITAVDQLPEDARFFEGLFKYGECK